MQELAPGIVVSTEFRRITVGAYATGRGIVCIDVPPFPEDARRWRARLEEHFRQPIRLVVLTDAQRDRLLGLHWFDDATILAHDAAAREIAALPPNYIDLSADLLAMNSDERMAFSGVRLRRPRVSFSQRMTAYVEDVGIALLAMPGPTPGNIWVQFPEQGIVFVGDSVVVSTPPYMTRMCSKAWLESLTLLRRPRFGAEVIVPGRGPVTDRDATQPLSEWLRYVRRRVQYLVRAGRERAAVLEIVPDVIARLEVAPAERDDLERRLKIGLEAVFEEFVRESLAAEESSEESASPEGLEDV
ncbi:MAG: hypothetical protein Kow0077_29940 [Anaerolineae bacterium]